MLHHAMAQHADMLCSIVSCDTACYMLHRVQVVPVTTMATFTNATNKVEKVSADVWYGVV